jgi:hypothetical protein
MTHEFMATLTGRPTAIPQPQPRLETPTLDYQTLNPPRAYSVRFGYFPHSTRHIVVNPNDTVIVFAATNDLTESIVYIARTETYGRIPNGYFYNPRTYTGSRLCLATSDEGGSSPRHVQ